MFKVPGVDVGAGRKEIFGFLGGIFGGGGGSVTVSQASVQSRQAVNVVEAL